MVRTREQIEATKKILNASLARIVNEYNTIDTQMNALPHKNGGAHQSLDCKTGQYVVQRTEGMSADFIDNDGQRYRIQIYRNN